MPSTVSTNNVSHVEARHLLQAIFYPYSRVSTSFNPAAPPHDAMNKTAIEHPNLTHEQRYKKALEGLEDSTVRGQLQTQAIRGWPGYN